MAKLVQARVADLLGHFDHVVDFPQEHDFVIVHGPNGVGKTHLLRLIQALLSGRFWTLRTIRFATVELIFDSGHVLAATRTRREIDVRRPRSKAPVVSHHVEVLLSKNGRNLEKWEDFTTDSDAILPPQSRVFLEYEIGLERTGPDTWYDPSTDEMLTTEDVISIHLEDGHLGGREAPGRVRSLGAKLEKFLDETPSRLVETQRLLTMSRQQDVPRPRRQSTRKSTVAEFARDLARVIQKNQADNARISSQLDRSFPQRVLARPEVDESITEELVARYANQDKLRHQLSDVGLLSDSSEPISIEELRLDSTARKLLATYLDDAETKLGVFKDMLDRITLLREVINERFLFKTMLLDAKRGFYFVTSEGEELKPELLSSGEQHELVLLYELLFRTEPGSLVMIDEPEISLHVKWQREFLNDITDVARLADLRFIVATHSPQVVDRWIDRAVVLAPVDE